VAQDAVALDMSAISKSFPGVRALDGVSFDCAPGEVHALCGENGAGKSTLIKVLGGVYRPDSGEIKLAGREVTFTHPGEARRAGISIIHQELSLLPERSVAENIYLGVEPTRFGMLDRARMRDGANVLLKRLGSSISPEARAGDLPIGQQQIVEIAKALAIDARILVMDEPTAALDDVEAARLLDLVRRLSSEGVSIIYISHRMPEIQAIARRVTVLKDGRSVLTAPIAEASTGRLVRAMVGRDLADFYPPRPTSPPGAVLLEIRDAGNRRLRNVSLSLRAGEIVGVAGLEGSGKTSLARALFGDEPFETGAIVIKGEAFDPKRPRAAIKAGIGCLSDDRKREGLALQQSVRDNALLTQRAFANALSPPSAKPMSIAESDRQLRRVDVRAASYDQEIRLLSGGNQQKTIIARWLAREPDILIFCEPTRGVDVAAKASIYKLMREAAERQRAILMISSDLPEVIGVSDRILVMREGAIAGELTAGASEEDVMALAVGHGRQVEEAAV
jgi:ribose transport system ATP-binding protein